jgi:hypothetical protein
MPSKESEPNEQNVLTIEKLRTFEGFENIRDEEAEEIILNLSILSSILYKTYQNHTCRIK